jgi:hypothetical protein
LSRSDKEKRKKGKKGREVEELSKQTERKGKENHIISSGEFS